MPRSRIAIGGSDLQPQFLDGLAPLQRKAILRPATKRRFCANSVATNEGHPSMTLSALSSDTCSARTASSSFWFFLVRIYRRLD
jgi:hypothetical protein